MQKNTGFYPIRFFLLSFPVKVRCMKINNILRLWHILSSYWVNVIFGLFSSNAEFCKLLKSHVNSKFRCKIFYRGFYMFSQCLAISSQYSVLPVKFSIDSPLIEVIDNICMKNVSEFNFLFVL